MTYKTRQCPVFSKSLEQLKTEQRRAQFAALVREIFQLNQLDTYTDIDAFLACANIRAF
jgi:hypothetical protein